MVLEDLLDKRAVLVVHRFDQRRVMEEPGRSVGTGLGEFRDRKVAYLPGLAMRRIADRYPGEAKTDAKDAAVIADAARTTPHTLRSLELTDEITAELTVLVGFAHGKRVTDDLRDNLCTTQAFPSTRS